MPTAPSTTTPDLDAFLRLHGQETGALPGESDPARRSTWLCWMCWVAPVGAPALEPAVR